MATSSRFLLLSGSGILWTAAVRVVTALGSRNWWWEDTICISIYILRKLFYSTMERVFWSKAVQSSDNLNKFKLESYKEDYRRKQEESSLNGSQSQRPWAKQTPKWALTPACAERESFPRLSSNWNEAGAEIAGHGGRTYTKPQTPVWVPVSVPEEVICQQMEWNCKGLVLVKKWSCL